MKEIFITKSGYHKLLAELDVLKGVRKPKVTQEIKEALEKGDLKENAEYHAAKEELTHIERRISELQTKMGQARILENETISDDRVYIGATVHLRDAGDGAEFSYTLMDSEESNPAEGVISVHSPVGQALLDHKVGDDVDVTVGKNSFKFKVLKIERKL